MHQPAVEGADLGPNAAGHDTQCLRMELRQRGQDCWTTSRRCRGITVRALGLAPKLALAQLTHKVGNGDCANGTASEESTGLVDQDATAHKQPETHHSATKTRGKRSGRCGRPPTLKWRRLKERTKAQAMLDARPAIRQC